MICPYCNGRGKVTYFEETARDETTVKIERRKGICPACNGSGKKTETNADRIRAMSDDELAKWLGSLRYGFGCELCANVVEKCDENCVEHFMEWLQQPCEGD